jgi:hypothetical protein
MAGRSIRRLWCHAGTVAAGPSARPIAAVREQAEPDRDETSAPCANARQRTAQAINNDDRRQQLYAARLTNPIRMVAMGVPRRDAQPEADRGDCGGLVDRPFVTARAVDATNPGIGE